jgi:hypothetical protein
VSATSDDILTHFWHSKQFVPSFLPTSEENLSSSSCIYRHLQTITTNKSHGLFQIRTKCLIGCGVINFLNLLVAIIPYEDFVIFQNLKPDAAQLLESISNYW